MNRRHFIRSAIAAEKPKRLILRSPWQTVNKILPEPKRRLRRRVKW